MNHLKTKLPIEILNEGDYYIYLLSIIHFKRTLISKDIKPISIKFEVEGNFWPTEFSITKRPGVIAEISKWDII